MAALWLRSIPSNVLPQRTIIILPPGAIDTSPSTHKNTVTPIITCGHNMSKFLEASARNLVSSAPLSCVCMCVYRRAKRNKEAISLGYLGNVVDLW